MTGTCFSTSYREARERFLERADALGAPVVTHTNPVATGPAGEELATDVVDLTVPDADRALVLVCGTHGVEGFAGSAILLDRLPMLTALRELGIGVVAAHSLNPYGFAWLRRVNEDNVDLNRNFVDHARPPHNDPYEQVHEALVLSDWNGPSHAAADAALGGLLERCGPRHVQAAITGGQWRHEDGLFYGGTAPVWSNRTWRRIIRDALPGHRHVAYIDLHTGLGRRGHGEPIFRGGRDPGALARARRWYGQALTQSEDGTSSSTPITGNTASALADELGDGTRLTAITLEFGTRSELSVLSALRADNWLHLHGGPDAPQAAEVHAQMNDAFCPDDPAWRTDVLAAAARVIDRCVAGLRDG